MNTKIFALALALGAVASANAVNVLVSIQGTSTYTGGMTGPFSIASFTPGYSASTAGATVSGVSYTTQTSGAGAGSLTITTNGLVGVANGTSLVNFNYTGNELFFGTFGSMTSSAFSVGTITGPLAGSTLYLDNNTKAVISDTLVSSSSSSNTTLRFTLATPVPEPSAFAALGLGGLALLRRRRKA